jgi:hypothetical protein
MYKYYIATTKSSRGINVIKFHTTVPQESKVAFEKVIVEKIEEYYYGGVRGIEIIAVVEERNIVRL